ncbi:MAG: Gfo/Idh/MocA family oxidoreductase [Chloroflexi bacterium]|nr:Gfo/Idh/MocA family oxidoreductase [Chloroflexota bacterium]
MAVSYKETYRAAVLGHTGRGNYGHGLDIAFAGLPGVEIVAVADPDDAGRQRAVERTGAARGYADYRELLEHERPNLVAIAPREPDQREAMFLAAVRAGAKAIYSEKPFARSLDEADRILAACDAHGVKVAVAHQNRAFPGGQFVRRLVAEGKIGRLRALRAYGKQDRRGGGQDLMVLGTHMLDLMRYFVGDARWCHARVVQDGHDATPADVRPAEEQAGLIAGDDIFAAFGFDHGVTGTYESARAGDGGKGNYFRMDLCGTDGILTIWSSATMPVYFYPRPFSLPDRPDEWQVLDPEPLAMPAGAPAGASAMHPANQVLVRDLLAAVDEDRPPRSGGHDARAALEMIMAVYESHIEGGRVGLPLEQRTHPLARWGAADKSR